MRTYLVLVLVALFAAPAAVATVSAGDGTLTVRNGDGVVRLNLTRGAVLGKIATGRLVVVDPDAECEELFVRGEEDLVEKPIPVERGQRQDGERRAQCIFTGTSMRFRLIGGQQEVRISGRGISISAVGRGRVYLKGSPRPRDGVYSLNGGDFKSLPDDGEAFQLGATASLP